MKNLLITFLILLTVAGSAVADGPLFGHKDKFIEQEFTNVYHDISNAGVDIDPLTTSSATITAGTVTTLRTSGIVGTTTDDNAAAGHVGEVLSATTVDVANAAGSDVWDDLLSLSLTAGDWDVTASLRWQSNGATWSRISCAVTSVSGNDSSDIILGINGDDFTFANTSTAVTERVCLVPRRRVSINATTTWYLKRRAVYSAGTPRQAGGARIIARRVR